MDIMIFYNFSKRILMNYLFLLNFNSKYLLVKSSNANFWGNTGRILHSYAVRCLRIVSKAFISKALKIGKWLGSMQHITLHKQTHHHIAMTDDSTVHAHTCRHTPSAVQLPRSSSSLSIMTTDSSCGWNRTHC